MTTKKALKEKLSNAYQGPGIYLMKDSDERIIYVGKAKNLKKRLTSYFRGPWQADLKTRALVQKISTIETIITDTEKEALILESSLIKRHKPKYNIDLKDDKKYPFLRLDINHDYPNLSIVRKTPLDGALYFGPYTSVKAARETFQIIKKTFKLRKCHTKSFKNRSRPCLHFQMQNCEGPCCLNIDKEAYRQIVDEVTLFLKGKSRDLIRRLKKMMLNASENQEYEKAAILRDKISSIEKTLEKQVIASSDFKDRDVIALASSTKASLIAVLSIRGGVVQGTRDYKFTDTLSTDSEIVSLFIRQHYEKSAFIPPEIFVSALPEDSALLRGRLKILRGKKVNILKPVRGEKVGILKIAVKNAEILLKEHIKRLENCSDLLDRLQKQLKISKIPKRIECFDNSNISGTSAVAGMVVFINGSPKKSSYRKYKIKEVNIHDDYAYMKEALTRRYKRKPFPDLLLVDGGRGQVNTAVAVVMDLGIEGKFDIAGIAKKDPKRGETADKIYVQGRSNPVNISSDVLLFLQKIRDEAHRFALSFHRKRRKTSAMSSELDNIQGIGKKRKAALFKHFKSIERIREADIKELSQVKGMNMAAAKSLKKNL